MRSPCRADRRRPRAVAVGLVALLGAGALAAVPAAAAPAQTGGDVPLEQPTPDPDDVRAEAERILTDDQFARESADGTTGSGGGAGGGGGEPVDPPGEVPDIPQPAPFTGVGAIGQVIMWILVVALVALAAWVIARPRTSRRRRTDDEVLY